MSFKLTLSIMEYMWRHNYLGNWDLERTYSMAEKGMLQSINYGIIQHGIHTLIQISNTHSVLSGEAGQQWRWLMCKKPCNITVLEVIQKLMVGKFKSGVGSELAKLYGYRKKSPGNRLSSGGQSQNKWQLHRDNRGSFETGRLTNQLECRSELKTGQSWGRWTENYWRW